MSDSVGCCHGNIGARLVHQLGDLEMLHSVNQLSLISTIPRRRHVVLRVDAVVVMAALEVVNVSAIADLGVGSNHH